MDGIFGCSTEVPTTLNKWSQFFWNCITPTNNRCYKLDNQQQSLMWYSCYFKRPSLKESSVTLTVVGSTSRSDVVNGEKIAATSFPVLTSHSVLKLSIKSCKLIANTDNGEDAALCKLHLFEGQSFEIQFALRLKGDAAISGTLGKVVIEGITQGNCQTVTDLILDVGEEVSVEQTASEWTSLCFHELCNSLELINEQHDIETLCEDLGFTNYEIKNTVLVSENPLHASIKCFKNRHGTAEEFIRKLYECKRKRNLRSLTDGDSHDVTLTSQLSSVSTATAHVSTEEAELQEAAQLMLTPPPTPRKRRSDDDLTGCSKRRNLTLEFESHDNTSEAETLPADSIQITPSTPRRMDVPLTPPPTPLKRLTSSTEKRKHFVFPLTLT